MAKKSWEQSVREQLKAELGKGWSVSEQSERIKLTRRDPTDGSRSSVMLDLPWGVPTTALQVVNAVAELRDRMRDRELTLRAAHELDTTAVATSEIDWALIAERFLDSLKGRKATTLGDVRTRVKRTLQTLAAKPAPGDGREVMAGR